MSDVPEKLLYEVGVTYIDVLHVHSEDENAWYVSYHETGAGLLYSKRLCAYPRGHVFTDREAALDHLKHRLRERIEFLRKGLAEASVLLDAINDGLLGQFNVLRDRLPALEELDQDDDDVDDDDDDIDDDEDWHELDDDERDDDETDDDEDEED
jgi:hypothetical protein